MDLEVSNHILEDKTSTPVNLHIEPLNRMQRKIMDADVACNVSGIKVYEDEDAVEKENSEPQEDIDLNKVDLAGFF